MFKIEDIEKCLKEMSPEISLTRIYPDGKEHPDIPGLYYASDKFWEEYDVYFKRAIKNITLD